LLAILTGKNTKHSLSFQLSSAVEKAGGILVIIGAGGAFGAVLAATNIGGHFKENLDLEDVGYLVSFFVNLSY
jgi:GntP family gluconate:H+ symporter